MDNKISRNSVVVVAENQVSSELLDDEVVVLDVQEGAYFVLNPVGARVWSLIQEPKTVGELVDALRDEYDVEEERCAREVIDLLQDLAGRKLIDIGDEAT